MNKLLQKIYENVIYYEKDTQIAEKRIETEIQTLLEPYYKKYTQEDFEIIRGLMYATEAKALQEGYQLGVRHTLQIFISLLTKL